MKTLNKKSIGTYSSIKMSPKYYAEKAFNKVKTKYPYTYKKLGE